MQTDYRTSTVARVHSCLRRVLLGAVLVYAAPVVSSDAVEHEIRCCVGALDVKDFASNLAIHLQGDEYPIGHLKVLAPGGEMLGFDEQSGLFHSITKVGVYALIPDSELPIRDPMHHRSNPRVAFLFSLESGTYSTKVIGQRAGKYTISFRPAGFQVLAYSTVFSGISIKAGEVHTYVFTGKYADPRDAAITPSHPNAFRVRRLEQNPKH